MSYSHTRGWGKLRKETVPKIHVASRTRQHELAVLFFKTQRKKFAFFPAPRRRDDLTRPDKSRNEAFGRAHFYLQRKYNLILQSLK